ncbi:hypothetical protein [Streptococcus suis]|uniref:hypothetical protein n=1 Tax=Streptococcus suis TaxID=1307 RepID=UPI001ABED0C6|nr:hypothetical protein [Streptococcus suis]
MEIWQILSLIGLGLSFILLVISLFLLYQEFDEEDEEDKEDEKPNQHLAYSQEDLALAEFLETRQAVNEDFLSAQNQLLKELFSQHNRNL